MERATTLNSMTSINIVQAIELDLQNCRNVQSQIVRYGEENERVYDGTPLDVLYNDGSGHSMYKRYHSERYENMA